MIPLPESVVAQVVVAQVAQQIQAQDQVAPQI
jgi:hypothetical protein